MNPAIETTNLTRDFGPLRAVNLLNLRVEAGCFYGFLGPNGAGKSTTIKMLTGLLAPSAGTIRILGQDERAYGRAWGYFLFLGTQRCHLWIPKTEPKTASECP